MTGAEAIAAERQRQIEQEGYTAEHDRQHPPEVLARAAACYATPPERRQMVSRLAVGRGDRGVRYRAVPEEWPWHPDDWKPEWAYRDLVRAGALIAAALDRMEGDR